MSMIKILSDFNNRDEQGRVRLSTIGALRDISVHRSELREGLEVLLYEDEFEMIARLVYDLGMWKGILREETIRYYDEH